MAKRIIEQQDNFILYTTFIGEDQAYITASVKNGKTDPISTGQAI